MQNNRYLTLFALIPLLAACGGGGGGGGVAGAMPATSGPGNSDHYVETQQDQLQIALNVAQSASSIDAAGTALPKFGSVTQSSNVGGDGITLDGASASFDGQTASVAVTRPGGQFSLNSNTASYLGGSMPESFLQWYALGSLDSGRYSFHAEGPAVYSWDSLYVLWDGDDPSDYIVWGHWMHADGQPTLPDTPFEVGAFIDGPEISSPATLPASGTATYVGWQGGPYQYTYGDQSSSPGMVEIGYYSGTATLQANFADSTVRYGCDHERCEGGALVWGEARAPDGTVYRFNGVESDWHFTPSGTAQIQSDGSFRSGNLEALESNWPLAEFEGSFGGKFSNIPDANGDPRAVFGTTGANYRTEDGGTGSYVGAFGARKEE